MTTSEYFNELLERVNLKIDDAERAMIEEKQNALREALRAKLALKDDFLTGSYRRHTIIKPKKAGDKFDVDVLVAFDNEDYGEKDLADLRKMVATALYEIKDEEKELGITNVSDSQRRSVCVEFGNDFRIDVVPAIEIEKDKLYKIFDRRTLKALKSNPKLHATLLSEANDRTGGKLVPIVKILKGWKRLKCDYLKSFHLEMLALQVLGGEEIESYAAGMAKFFAEAGDWLAKACLADPANKEHLIDAYLDDDGTRQSLLDLMKQESKIANHAEHSDRTEEESVEDWKQIFDDHDGKTAEAIRSGGFFPAAGGIATGSSSSHAKPIDAPRSWGG